MAYRNQNYMTNRKIKEEVDKNQKGYIDPNAQEPQQEQPKTVNITVTVKDVEDESITGANVSIGNKSGTTTNGTVTIENVSIADNVAITATAENYKDYSNTTNITSSTTTLTIIMEPKDLSSPTVTGPTMIEEEGEF